MLIGLTVLSYRYEGLRRENLLEVVRRLKRMVSQSLFFILVCPRWSRAAALLVLFVSLRW